MSDKRSEKTLGEALASYLTKSGLVRATGSRAVQEAWREVMGDEVARHSRATSLRGGVLRVEVDSAAWLYELANMDQQDVLEKLQEKLPGRKLVQVKFRLGVQ